MKRPQRHTEPQPAATPPATYGGAHARALSIEAVRLSWNRASQRIVHAAQEKVALEPADALTPSL